MKKVFWYLLERKIIHYLSTNRSVLTQEVRVFVSKYWFLELDSCFKIFSFFEFLKFRISNFAKFENKNFTLIFSRNLPLFRMWNLLCFPWLWSLLLWLCIVWFLRLSYTTTKKLSYSSFQSSLSSKYSKYSSLLFFYFFE